MFAREGGGEKEARSYGGRGREIKKGAICGIFSGQTHH